jgi:hypothetical protein
VKRKRLALVLFFLLWPTLFAWVRGPVTGSPEGPFPTTPPPTLQ